VDGGRRDLLQQQWESLKTKDVMLQRVGQVREVANATLFFACDESSYCTATSLMVRLACVGLIAAGGWRPDSMHRYGGVAGYSLSKMQLRRE
jgi:hypothetical protein